MSRIFLCVFFLFLAACGGGSSTSDNSGAEPIADVDIPVVGDDVGDDNDTTEDTVDEPGDSEQADGDGLADDPNSNNDSDYLISDAVLSADEFSKRVVSEGFDISGAVTPGDSGYQSSNPAIAMVSDNGWVEILQPGEVTISSVASDTTNTTSTTKALPSNSKTLSSHPSSTSVEIIAKDNHFFFKTWVGEDDTILDFNDSLYGLTVFIGAGQNCNPITEENCETLNGQIISEANIVDQNSTLSDPGYQHFTFGNNQAASAFISAEKFEVRSGEATVVFNDKLYLVGGYTTGDVNNLREYKNDVWMSEDGDEWFEISESAEFSERAGHQLVVHEDRLWLIGGATGGTLYDDVWTSSDGKTWSQVTQQNAFSERSYFELFSLNGELFIAGGYADEGEQLNDLWRSSDGASWSKVSEFSFAQANNTPVVVVGDSPSQTAYLFGDQSYRTSDGQNWQQIDDETIFAGFDNREAAFINNEFWLFTYTFEYFGTNYGSKNISRVYKSGDGEDWQKVVGGIYLGNLVAREAQPLAFKNRLYIVGGRAEILEYTNEVWSTTDASLWIEHTSGGFYGPRYGHAMTSHDGKLFSTGGVASENISVAEPYKSDVWSSDDGLNWTLVAEGHPTFRPRSGHALVSADDKLCYVGGHGRRVWGTASGYRSPYTVQDPDPAGSVLHVILFQIYGVFGDVACSIDGGEVWHEVVPSTDDYFDEREGFASIYFNNKLWIIGGNFNSTYFSDVWATENIDDWEDGLDRYTYGAYFTEFSEVVDEAAFGPRTGHAVTIHNDELYLSAGKNSDGFYLDDLWKSSDGENWTLVNANMGDMHKRAYHQMISFDNKLWVIAGRANYHETLVFEDTTVYEANDIWVSEDDGITWIEVTEHASFEQRQNFQAVAHDNAIFITGGTGGDGYVTVQGKDSILNDVWKSEDGYNWRAGFYKELRLGE